MKLPTSPLELRLRGGSNIPIMQCPHSCPPTFPIENKEFDCRSMMVWAPQCVPMFSCGPLVLFDFTDTEESQKPSQCGCSATSPDDSPNTPPNRIPRAEESFMAQAGSSMDTRVSSCSCGGNSTSSPGARRLSQTGNGSSTRIGRRASLGSNTNSGQSISLLTVDPVPGGNPSSEISPPQEPKASSTPQEPIASSTPQSPCSLTGRRASFGAGAGPGPQFVSLLTVSNPSGGEPSSGIRTPQGPIERSTPQSPGSQTGRRASLGAGAGADPQEFVSFLTVSNSSGCEPCSEKSTPQGPIEESMPQSPGSGVVNLSADSPADPSSVTNNANLLSVTPDCTANCSSPGHAEGSLSQSVSRQEMNPLEILVGGELEESRKKRMIMDITNNLSTLENQEKNYLTDVRQFRLQRQREALNALTIAFNQLSSKYNLSPVSPMK